MVQTVIPFLNGKKTHKTHEMLMSRSFLDETKYGSTLFHHHLPLCNGVWAYVTNRCSIAILQIFLLWSNWWKYFYTFESGIALRSGNLGVKYTRMLTYLLHRNMNHAVKMQIFSNVAINKHTGLFWCWWHPGNTLPDFYNHQHSAIPSPCFVPSVEIALWKSTDLVW